jgi:hypothetical protein
MFHNKEDSIVQSCKIKANLTFKERGLTIPRQKNSDMLSLSSLECTCRKFSKQPRENLGIEKVVPQTEFKAKIGYIRYDNQCNANRPGMH